MRVLILTVTSLATFCNAAPDGLHGGSVLSGPSGIVTSQGAIGPAALGLGGLGAYGGHGGAFLGGPAAPSSWVSGPVGPSSYVAGPALSQASVVGPAAGIGGHGLGLGLGGNFGALRGGPGGFGGLAGLGGHGGYEGYGGFGGIGGLGGIGGFGGFGGYGGYGGYRGGLGLAPGVTVTNGGGTIGIGPHSVMVKGPATVPATIAGPAGKIVANGLYGLPTHGGHGW